MISTRAGILLSAFMLLAGCATANIQPSDLNALGPTPTVDEVNKIAHGAPLQRMDYLVDGQAYTFEVYEATDTAKYYGLLFQGGKLIAVDMAGAGSNGPGPSDCALFPPKPGMDVEGCFRGVNQALQANAVDLRQPVTPDQQAQQRAHQETAGAVAMGATEVAFLGPIMITVAVVTLPFIGAEKASEKSAQQSLGVKLGDPYEAIQSRVEQLPERDRSVKYGSGTVLVPGGLTSIPAAAFGLQDGKVIWLQLDPPTSCGEGFILWDKQCRMNTSAPGRRQVPRRPRPPVIDAWENIAIYYSPPPQFDVLGEASGKVGRGFTSKGRMEGAIEDMKKEARKDGATALLLEAQVDPDGQEVTTAPGTGTPVYGADAAVPLRGAWATTLEIYVPADADAFLKAVPLHTTTCDALSQKRDDAKDAYKEVKGTGTPDAVAAAKQTLQSAEDAKDAAFCGDDDWYAEQVAAQKH